MKCLNSSTDIEVEEHMFALVSRQPREQLFDDVFEQKCDGCE
jgi:hypothetical protein